MSLQTTFQLHTIRCIAQSEDSGSEPYVWPFLCTAATGPGTFDTFPTAAILAESRKVIASSMKAGASAQLEFPGNLVTHSFADGQTECTAILIVALLEADENRTVSMQAGFQAYLDELRLRMGHNILALKTATDAEREVIIAEIKAHVQARVRDAIKSTLTTGEKAGIFFGWMDTDDFLAVDFLFAENLETAPPASAFTLGFVTGGNRFEIDGVRNVASIQPDPCQAQIDGVAAAEQAIASLHHRIELLQRMLATATPQQKPAIIDEIGRIRAEDIPEAEADLRRAEGALRRCETFGGIRDDIVIEPAPPIMG